MNKYDKKISNTSDKQGTHNPIYDYNPLKNLGVGHIRRDTYKLSLFCSKSEWISDVFMLTPKMRSNTI